MDGLTHDRRELAFGWRSLPSTALYSAVVQTVTMMQSYASGAKLLGVAPFFSSA